MVHYCSVAGSVEHCINNNILVGNVYHYIYRWDAIIIINDVDKLKILNLKC